MRHKQFGSVNHKLLARVPIQYHFKLYHADDEQSSREVQTHI